MYAATDISMRYRFFQFLLIFNCYVHVKNEVKEPAKCESDSPMNNMKTDMANLQGFCCLLFGYGPLKSDKVCIRTAKVMMIKGSTGWMNN